MDAQDIAIDVQNLTVAMAQMCCYKISIFL